MRFRVLSAALLSGFLAAPALAIEGVSVESGFGTHTRMQRIGLQWWSDRQWPRGDTWHVGMYWDLALGQWHRDGVYPGQTGHITEIGLTPVFRLQNNSQRGLYAEAGVGAYVLSSTTLAFRQFSTGFQFGSHLGLGYRFGATGQYDLSLRVQHLSNADIKQPNEGINFGMVHLQYWY